MDLPFVFAGIVGFCIGAIVGSIVVFTRLRAKPWILLAALALALLVQAGLSVHWHGLESLERVRVLDFGVITIYSLVGCVLGAFPPVAARHLLRRWRRF